MRPAILAAFLVLTVQTTGAAAYSVRVVPNVSYAAGKPAEHKTDQVDIYLPEGKKLFPVVLAIHGGGLTAGDKSEETHIGRTLARAGVGTVVINYRLSPSVSHPGHIEDVAEAFAWVKHHIADYGGDPSNVYLVGHSAGAYLISLLALDPHYLAVHKLSPADIGGVISVSGFYDVTSVAPSRSRQIWGYDPVVWRAASPIHHVRANAPPFLILYADHDELWRRSQNQEMAAALKKAGHPKVEIRQILHRDHMSVWYNINDGDEVANSILSFVLKS